ncbi:MAG: AI-2E family transporter [Gammaproteobacteria bacterium]
MNKFVYPKYWFYLILTIVAAGLLYLLAPVLTPFMVAALLAYLADPFTEWLEAHKLPRTTAVWVVFFVMTSLALLLLLILVPLLHEQLQTLFSRLPELIEWLEDEAVPMLAQYVGIDIGDLNLHVVQDTLMSHWRDVSNLLGMAALRLSQSGEAIVLWFFHLLLIPLVTFYLLRDWNVLLDKIHGLLPRAHQPLISRLARECDLVLAEFLRGQLLVMFFLGLIYSVGLWLIGIEFALLIGMLAGLISFVPYMGTIVGLSLAAIVAFTHYGDVLHLAYVALVFIFGQTIEALVLSPLLVGDRIGLHPIAVVFAVMVGGQLYGLVGILLALPTAAVIMVLLRHLHQHYLNSELYSQ